MAKRYQTERGRLYEVETGEFYPSVTTILQVIGKPALMHWAAKMEREMVLSVSADLYEDLAEVKKMSRTGWMSTMQTRLGKAKAAQKELAKASEIGSQTHALIEWVLKAQMCEEAGPSPHITDKAQWAFMAWEDWRRKVKLTPIRIEQTVWSKEHQYAGTMDLLAEVEGELTVLDWKTGKAVYPEAHLQNSAYRHAVREMGHGDPVRGLIVRLPKVETDPNFEVVEAMPEGKAFPAFLQARKLWGWLEELNGERESKKAEQDLEKPLQASINSLVPRATIPAMEVK